MKTIFSHPKQSISEEGTGIFLRAFNMSDVEKIYRISQLPSVAINYSGYVAGGANPDGKASFQSDWQMDFPGAIGIVALLAGSETIIGAAQVKSGRVSFFVDPAHWGCGIATLMLTSLLTCRAEIGNQGKLFAFVLRGNERSIALVERFSFRFEGLVTPAFGRFLGNTLLKYVRR